MDAVKFVKDTIESFYNTSTNWVEVARATIQKSGNPTAIALFEWSVL